MRRVQAKALLSVCRVAGAKLIIDEDVWLAIEIGADGAHVAHHSAPGRSLATAREALGTHRLLGVSCPHDLAIAADAAKAGADYLTFGAMFVSPSHTHPATAPLNVLSTAKRKLKLPVCAIGGVSLHNAPEAIEAGADMVAVTTGLFDVMNISRQAKLFQSLFTPSV